jgi:hypothetical protein
MPILRRSRRQEDPPDHRTLTNHLVVVVAPLADGRETFARLRIGGDIGSLHPNGGCLGLPSCQYWHRDDTRPRGARSPPNGGATPWRNCRGYHLHFDVLRRCNSENQRRRAATIYSRATYYSRRCNSCGVARAGDLACSLIIAVKPQTRVSRHSPDERDRPRRPGRAA